MLFLNIWWLYYDLTSLPWKPILFRSLTKAEKLYYFVIYQGSIEQQNPYMSYLFFLKRYTGKCSTAILWCSRCKIHLHGAAIAVLPLIAMKVRLSRTEEGRVMIKWSCLICYSLLPCRSQLSLRGVQLLLPATQAWLTLSLKLCIWKYTDVPKKKDQLRWHSPCPSLVLDRQFFSVPSGGYNFVWID
jgi:hypothetical protein